MVQLPAYFRDATKRNMLMDSELALGVIGASVESAVRSVSQYQRAAAFFLREYFSRYFLYNPKKVTKERFPAD